MANFPTREPDIARLAQDIANGLAANRETFPAPPVGADQLEAALRDYNTARDAALTASATGVQGTAAKERALSGMVEMMKAILRYAEVVVRNDDGSLQLLGWGARRKKTPTEELKIPGQVITLEVEREGNTWLSLAWNEPFDGGEVSAYRIQRRKRDTGDWLDVGTAVRTESTLQDQQPGVEWEFRVIAVNTAGEGPASNIVRAVL